MICESIAHATAGTHIETEVHGKRELKILEKKETYRINSPKLLMRFLPFPGVDWSEMSRFDAKKRALKPT